MDLGETRIETRGCIGKLRQCFSAKGKTNAEMSSENCTKQLMMCVSIRSCSSVDFEESQSFKVLRYISDCMTNL